MRTRHVVVSGLVFLAYGMLLMTRSASSLVVMTYNVKSGHNIKGSLNIPDQANVILDAGAQLVGMQELDNMTTRSGGVDQPAEFSELTGMYDVYTETIPYQGGEYGIGGLSDFTVEFYQEYHYKSYSNEARACFGIRLLPQELGGKIGLLFINTHLDLDEDCRVDEIAELKTFIDSTLRVKYPNDTVIVTGDFNATPEDQPVLDMKEDYYEVWDLAGTGSGYTFPSDTPTEKIDYIFINKDSQLAVKVLNTWIPDSTCSDHRPLVAELSFS